MPGNNGGNCEDYFPAYVCRYGDLTLKLKESTMTFIEKFSWAFERTLLPFNGIFENGFDDTSSRSSSLLKHRHITINKETYNIEVYFGRRIPSEFLWSTDEWSTTELDLNPVYWITKFNGVGQLAVNPKLYSDSALAAKAAQSPKFEENLKDYFQSNHFLFHPMCSTLHI